MSAKYPSLNYHSLSIVLSNKNGVPQKKAGSLAPNANNNVNASSTSVCSRSALCKANNKICPQGSCFNKINDYCSIIDILM